MPTFRAMEQAVFEIGAADSTGRPFVPIRMRSSTRMVQYSLHFLSGVYSMNILLALLLTQSMTSAEGLAKLPRFADYCTEAGPIYLGFDGQSVDASYRIILPSKDIPGTMKLQWSGPFLQGRWYDNDGDGPIIIVFHNEMNELTALYTSDDKVTSWSEVWPGTN